MFDKIRKYIDKKEHELSRQANIEETTVIETVDSFKDATGLEFFVKGVKWISAGVFMGASDAIPGYSGGTTLALVGIYKRIVLIAKSVFVPEPGLTRIKSLLFMIPFLIGWLSGIYGFAKLTELMFENHLQMELMFFFVGFIMFAIPIYIRSSQLGLFRDLSEDTPQNIKHRKNRRWRWALFFLGFFAVLGSAIYLLVVKHGANMSVIDSSGNHVTKYPIRDDWWKLMIVAYFAGALAIIPGGSGAIIQLLTGEYPHIHSEIMANFSENLGGVFLFAGFTIIGMTSTVFLMSWALKKHAKTAAALSFGMLIAAAAAVIIVIPAGSGNDNFNAWQEAAQNKWHIGATIGSFILGAVFATTLNTIIKRRARKRAR